MTKHEDQEPEFIRETKERQKNTICPDMVKNNRSVDRFLWSGSNKATKVQRIGGGILGLMLFVSGGALAFDAYLARAWGGIIITAILACFGAKIFYSTVVRPSSSRH